LRFIGLSPIKLRRILDGGLDGNLPSRYFFVLLQWISRGPGNRLWALHLVAI